MTAILSPDRRGPARWRCAAALALAGVMLAGCSVVNPPANPPPAAMATGATEFQALTATIIERARRLDTMQADAVMGYEGGGHHLKIREAIAIKRPASMRVEA